MKRASCLSRVIRDLIGLLRHVRVFALNGHSRALTRCALAHRVIWFSCGIWSLTGALRTWASGPPRQVYEFTLWAPPPASANTPSSPNNTRPALLSERDLFCPTGNPRMHAMRKLPVAPNMPHPIALAASGKSRAPFRPSRGLAEGRSRSSRTLAVGCDGRGTSSDE